MFIDKVKISVKAGDGGNGCMSFHREKFVPFGGPNGGNGGNGGDVVLRATSKEQSLIDLKYAPIVKGVNGRPGEGKNKHGANGDAKYVPVPVGTIVRDIARDYELLIDLSEDGQEFTVCVGGRGGFGNKHFQSNRNKLPRISEEGTTGEERSLDLELKTIADVGLIGLPNAGKSTLIGAITEAHPKVAPYPFTTLHPVVGIIEYDDFMRIQIADIPGLIEGAHKNVGLGHDFLRHVERTKVLAFVLDMACTDNRTPMEDLETLKQELEFYKEGITSTSSLIVANKMDDELAAEQLDILRKSTDLPIFEVCAVTGEGVIALTDYLHDLFKNTDLKQACLTDRDSHIVEVCLDGSDKTEDEENDDFWEF